jgi:hypothetical protein
LVVIKKLKLKLKMNTIIKNTGIIIVVLGVMFMVYNYNEAVNEDVNEKIQTEKQIIWEDGYEVKLVGDLEEVGINFFEKDTVSYSLKRKRDVVEEYEISAKEKSKNTLLEFYSDNNEILSANIKILDINQDNILYVLKTYTNYSEKNLSSVEISYNFIPDNFDKYKTEQEEINFGKVLYTDDKILAVTSVSNDGLSVFLNKFNEQNEHNGDYLDYLNSNKDILVKVNKLYKDQNSYIEESGKRVSDDIKKFGLKF